MPCIFCIGVFTMLAGTLGATLIDHIQASLASVAEGQVKKAADSGTMTRFEFDTPVPGRSGSNTSVVVTVYKKARRVRIQLLSHTLTREQVREIQRVIALVLNVEVVESTDDRDELEQEEHSHEASPVDGWMTTEESQARNRDR